MDRRRFTLGLALAAGTQFATAQRTRKVSAPATPAGVPAVIPVAPAPLVPSTGDRLLQLQPMAPSQPAETHSALIVSEQAFGAGGTPYRFAGRARTVRQLRQGSAANAWEVGWLFWNFADRNHLHYFVLKPNGWEIGKRDPRYAVPGVNDGQKIMATGDSVRLVPGRWYDFELRIAGAEADIYVDGVFVCRFRDTDAGAFTNGRVGLYTEDALCQWDAVSAPFQDGFDLEPVQPFVEGTQLTNWRVVFLGYGSGAIVPA